MSKKKGRLKKDHRRGLIPKELETSSELLFWLKVAIGFSLVLFLTLISPFAGKGLFSGHDILAHLIYLRQFEEAAFDGQLPVRWIDWFSPGFNQPLFNFYQPGFYYLFLFLRAVFGLSHTNALLVLVPFLWLLSSLFMFLFVRRHFGNLSGILAALFFTYAPYHIADVFVRAALTEFTALAFVPGLFWAIKSFWDTEKGYYLFLNAAFLGLIVLAHPPTIIMFSPLILLYLGYLFTSSKLKIQNSKLQSKVQNFGSRSGGPTSQVGNSTPGVVGHGGRKLILTLLSLLVGLGMIAFFILPAFFEQRFIQAIFMRSGYYDFHTHFVCWWQLFLPKWDYGLSLPGCDDGMPFQLGLAHWLVVAGILYFLLRGYVDKIVKSAILKHNKFAPEHELKVQSNSSKFKIQIGLLLVMLTALFFSLYLMFPVSMPFWESLPYLPFIQYPWRFLAVAIFASSFLAGALITFFKKDVYRYGVYLGLVGLLAVFYLPYLHPLRYFSRQELNFDDPRFLAGVPPRSGNLRPEIGYMPIWTDVLPAYENTPVEEVKMLKGTVKLQQSDLTATRKQYRLLAEEDSQVRFFTHYFPGWQVAIDNQPAQFTYDNIYGYIDVEIPAGEHRVELKFQDTPVRQWGHIVSVVAFLIGLGLIFLV